MKALADSNDRERFVKELGLNFCVSASAGAGKTTAIVQRIVALACREEARILRGEPSCLPRLAVVTYGVLAAEELRVRTRQEMFRHLSGDAGRRQQVLGEFNRAYFGTIHSFCLRLLREEGRHLGLPSSVQLLEEDDERLWYRFVETDYAWPETVDPEIPARVLRHYTFEQILKLAREMPPDAAEAIAGRAPARSGPVLDLSGAFEAKTRGKAVETLARHQEHLRQWLKDYESDDGYLELPHYEQGGKEFAEAVRNGFQPYVSWLNTCASHLAALVALCYRDYRVAQGYLTYDDMVAWAKKLLDNKKVLQRLRERDFIVILDEAQDTDSSMFAILTELTRPGAAELYEWPTKTEAAPPRPGSFCFVGDDQQTIYSKRADLAQYHKFVSAFQSGKGGQVLNFSVTMRCPQAVIRAVNTVFPGRLDQPLVHFRRLEPRPDAPEGGVRILNLKAPEDGKVAELFREEARQVSAWMAEQGLKGLGISSWSEAAVLCPRIDWLSVMSSELKTAGLPVRMVSSKEQRSELPGYSWPVALLWVLLHPSDRFELIGVLREIYGIADDELLRVHQERPEGLNLNSAAMCFERTAKALAELRELRGEWLKQQADGIFRLSRFIELLLERMALEKRILAIGEEAEPLQELRRAALIAEAEGVDFLDWVDGLKNELGKSPRIATGGSAEIQLLTSMKAKGLEWPVVVAPGLGRMIGQHRTEYPLIEKLEGRLQAHFNPLTMTEENKTRRQEARDLEFQRLFYVMMTRARRLLVLPDSQGFYKRSTPSFLGLIRREEVDWKDSIGETDFMPEAGIGTERGVEPALDADLIRKAVDSAKQIVRMVLPHKLAAHGDGNEFRVEAGMETVVGGMEYGTWWHEVMEQFPWKSSQGGHGDYLREKCALAPAGFRERGFKEMELFLAGPFYKELLGSESVFLSEIPFSAPLSPEAIMEGVIDLIVVDAEGKCGVVDWKTNRCKPDETEKDFAARLKSIYAAQLSAYGDMLEKRLGRSVTRRILYSTATGQRIEV
ncbi:MAG: UvrD-helicase domain-containing protein [Methylacidiphilales bacterium]|nr:UvrD-helicase domain-containing protein [Candidatus Methylacidiphilales bacterium]